MENELEDNRLQIKIKSNYKRHCSFCNNTINRGDLITAVLGCNKNGMYLRSKSWYNNEGKHKYSIMKNTGTEFVHLKCKKDGKYTVWQSKKEIEYEEYMFKYINNLICRL